MTGLVIVETRELENIREVVQNHIDFTGWPVMFFHSPHNEVQIKERLKGIDVEFVNLRTNYMNEASYNALLTSSFFWTQIPYDKILIFQHDSRLLRKGIEEFLGFDFIGAPWLWQKHGGNGGLSLRSKDAILRVIKERPYHAGLGNEDVYYSNAMYRNPAYNLAPRSECEKFSCEAIFKLGTFGVHAIEKWMGQDKINRILNQYDKGVLAPV